MSLICFYKFLYSFFHSSNYFEYLLYFVKLLKYMNMQAWLVLKSKIKWSNYKVFIHIY